MIYLALESEYKNDEKLVVYNDLVFVIQCIFRVYHIKDEVKIQGKRRLGIHLSKRALILEGSFVLILQDFLEINLCATHLHQ